MLSKKLRKSFKAAFSTFVFFPVNHCFVTENEISNSDELSSGRKKINKTEYYESSLFCNRNVNITSNLFIISVIKVRWK